MESGGGDSSPFAGMDKLRAEVSELLDSIETRHSAHLVREMRPSGTTPHPVLSPIRSRKSPVSLRPALVGLRGALRAAEQRNAELSADNATLSRRLSAVERELATRRLIERSYSETARIQRLHLKESATLHREVSRLRDEREKMLADISALMNIVRKKIISSD